MIPNPPFPIVGIGASAGGLEAFSQLLEALPSDTGMAFVLVQHLDPRHASQLTEILSSKTAMPISSVSDGMTVEAGHVYVIPPNTTLTIEGELLRLTPRSFTSGPHLPIDLFFRSLASNCGCACLGVVLSGTGSDGSKGLAAIKVEGGMTFAQDEASAKYSAMPRSAVAVGVVDFVLPPHAIAEELARIATHPYLLTNRSESGPEEPPADEPQLRTLFALLKAVTKVDFSLYKRTTIRRRMWRRMILHKRETVADYIAFLRRNPEEINDLFNDLLISLT